MSFDSWDPFQRLEEFRRDSSRMLDELLGHLPDPAARHESISFLPEVDLVESSNEFRFYLSIPGMVEDDIVIEVDGRRLTIRGERRPPYDVDNRVAQLKEWRYGVFVRHFELTCPVAVDSVNAAYDAGVLTIVVQKSTCESNDMTLDSENVPNPLHDDKGQ